MAVRRGFVGLVFVPLVVGILAMYIVMRRPTFVIHSMADVVTLVGAGMCFGVALMAFVVRIKKSK